MVYKIAIAALAGASGSAAPTQTVCRANAYRQNQFSNANLARRLNDVLAKRDSRYYSVTEEHSEHRDDVTVAKSYAETSTTKPQQTAQQPNSIKVKFEPGYKLKSQAQTTRIELSKATPNTSYYCFMDLDASDAEKLDYFKISGSEEFCRKLDGKLFLALRHQFNSTADDNLRLGLSYATPIPKGFFRLAYFPASTLGIDDLAKLTFNLKPSRRLDISQLLNYTPETDSFYSETAFDLKFPHNLELSLQGRTCFGAGVETKIEPVVAVKYRF